MNNAQFLQSAAEHCLKNGANLTNLRRQVLDLVLTHDGVVKAYQILTDLQQARGSAAPPTVYRTLDFLLEKGLIHRLTSINAYIPCCHPREGHQAAFLICTECRTVKEASAQGLLQQLDELSASDHFTAQHSIIEISGICQQCSKP